MVTRLMRFISETQARLGWVDTIGERLFFQMIRGIKGVIVTPRRLLASILIMLTLTKPTFILADLATNIGEIATGLGKVVTQTQAIYDSVKEASKLQEENWAKSLVHSFKQLKLSKAGFESISAYSLSEAVKAINTSSDINLDGSDFLGSTKETNEYMPLRVRSRSDESNYAETFESKLNNIAEQDFDAMQLIQYHASDAVGVEILKGDPKAAALKVEEQWKKILNDSNNLKVFDGLCKQAKLNLDAKEKREKEELSLSIRTLEDMGDTGEGHKKDAVVMRDLLELSHEINKKSLELGAKDIRNAKENNEINKSGITYMAEAAKIKAQIQSIINDVQSKVRQIIRLNVSANQSDDATNKLVDDIINKLQHGGQYNAKEDVLTKVKLRPSADAEINRLMTMANFAIKQQHIQLVDLHEKDRRIKAMDDVGKASFDLQKDFIQSFTPTNATLLRIAENSKKAAAAYRSEVDRLESNELRAALSKKNNKKSIPEQIARANTRYFNTIKNNVSLNLLTTTFDTYIKFVKGFLQGKKFKDVMKDGFSKAAAEENKRTNDMLKMYDDCAGETYV